MKTFAGLKKLDVIKSQCNAAGIRFDDTRYRQHGDDHVLIAGGGAHVLYNTFNGKFFGITPTGVEFDSSGTQHEHEPWFQALLSFFYVERGAAIAKATGCAS